ncbi:DNA-binding helix-turn-helix protein [Leptospira yanagawae serovar Saopaulo str. Sao Paulo = ATCC 700523]|uniref:DNA-binding helix-turn-helix protein n=1 Tax=Leptospira yanagawae serovar Saopaulo str. Sao Paulo = ATCC 700523 TaxID=1249483 RepID=A0A5E8H9E0_9LEPT|nr:helix-turn-helix transcriptional regulator [Leptospira yanagawae]EOQ87347.1 DNA-binding helix-turn-helix protein [Leptospira yanagawae serovar Saopaulo str. Sao Paulo = ATCC 700523]
MDEQKDESIGRNDLDQNVDEVLTVVLGETLKRRRLELGLSMEKLSQLSTVSRGMLGLIESGKTTPSIGILWKLSKTLRIPIAEMIPDLFSQSPRFIPANEGKVWISSKNSNKSRVLYQEDRERLNLVEWSMEQGKLNQFQHLPQAHDIKIYQVLGASKIKLKNKTYHLEVGESVFFPISELDSIENESDGLSKFLWISSKKFR